MTTPFTLPDASLERRRELRREAARAHLVAVARCCKPSEISRLASTLRHRLTKDGTTRR